MRLSTPDDWRLRAIGGAYWEEFHIYDDMNFNYKTIPSCNPANLTAALAGGPVCVADVRTAPGSTANDPGVRSDATAFGEDTQRGYNQYAVFGSVDYDIIPEVLTVTGGTRWYQYREYEVGSQYGTTTSCLNVPNGQCTGGMINIDAAQRPEDLFRLQEPRQRHLAHHAGHHGLLHLLAGLPSGRLQPVRRSRSRPAPAASTSSTSPMAMAPTPCKTRKSA